MAAMNNVMNNDSQQVEDAKQVYVLTFDLILSGFMIIGIGSPSFRWW